MEDPLDLYAAKTTCRRLFSTRRSLRDAFNLFSDNPWKVYVTEFWTEKPGDKELLCSLCRTKHPRKAFKKKERRERSDLTRSCWAEDGAIELAQPRLPTPLLKRAWHTGNYAQGLFWEKVDVFGMAVNAMLKSLAPPTKSGLLQHSPFSYDYEDSPPQC